MDTSSISFTALYTGHVWYANGLPDPIPSWMSQEEVEHQQWTHAQLGDKFKSFMQNWPFTHDETLEGYRLNFRHYGLNEEKNWFRPFLKNSTVSKLDQLFDDVEADLIFYGHNHVPDDQQGKAHYLNAGSAGCWDRSVVRLLIIDLHGGDQYDVIKVEARYSDRDLMKAFDIRKVPARDFIRKTFIVR